MMIKRLLNWRSGAIPGGSNWDDEAIAYAFTSFSAAAIHNIFIIYYVDLFMNVHQLDQSWFFLGETIYMLWNSINDPLFGWFLESWSLPERIKAIKYGGIAWSLSLLLIFLPSWSSLLDISSTTTAKTPTNLDLTDSWKTAIVGLHFALSICLYDGVLSLVLLTHGALLADIAVDSSKRAKINTYSSLFSVVGSNTVLVSQLFWSSSSPSSSSATSLSAFRIYTLFVAFISSLGFIYTSHYLPKSSSCSTSLSPHSKVLTATGEVYHPSSSSLASSPSSTSTVPRKLTLRTFASQLLRFRNFWIFILINLVQVFNCHFNSNFMSIFLDSLVGSGVSVFVHSFILSAAATLPHLFVVFLAPVIHKKSLYFLLQFLFLLKLSLAAFAYFGLSAESSTPWTLGVFLLCNKVFNEVICRHGNLVVADLVDEDCSLNKRPESASTVIYGANALFTKPGQSLAPMFGWALLRKVGYSSVINSTLEVREGIGGVRSGMFEMLVVLPAVCAVIQLVLWSQFTLKDSYLQKVKEQRRKVEV